MITKPLSQEKKDEKVIYTFFYSKLCLLILSYHSFKKLLSSKHNTQKFISNFKLQKEIVNINENPAKAIPDDSLVLNSDSRSVCVEIAGHTHVSRRTARTRNSPSRTLFVTKICLLIPALCSIIMGFSIVLHGLLTVNHILIRLHSDL